MLFTPVSSSRTYLTFAHHPTLTVTNHLLDCSKFFKRTQRKRKGSSIQFPNQQTSKLSKIIFPSALSAYRSSLCTTHFSPSAPYSQPPSQPSSSTRIFFPFDHNLILHLAPKIWPPPLFLPSQPSPAPTCSLPKTLVSSKRQSPNALRTPRSSFSELL